MEFSQLMLDIEFSGGVKRFNELCEHEYAQAEALNASLLRSAHRFPDHMVRKLVNQKGFGSSELSLGHLIHQFWLEPKLAEKSWSILPKKWESNVPEFRKKKAAFESEQKAQGRNILPESLWEEIQRGLDALNGNAEAVNLLSQSSTEQTIFWKDASFGVLAKSRFDLLSNEHFWDLKCHRGAMQEDRFKKNLIKMGFFIQMWWYQHSLIQLGVPSQRCGHIALDTDIWEVRIRETNSSELELGREQCLQAWARLKKICAGKFDVIYSS
jgi:hypothetical protein